jgi:V/A-type H+-transporting ATPase subunit D
MEKLSPTKANLIKLNDMLEFSRKGYHLLDEKRSVLILEMMAMIDEVEKLQIQIDEEFTFVYEALKYANVTIGAYAVGEISLSIPKDETIRILNKSVMNVEIPMIKFDQKEIMPSYGFYRSNASIDIIVVKMKAMMELLYRLAEVENAVIRLASEIRKTSIRANALQRIQIPKLEGNAKRIGESLEEKEREDFFRLKRVKGKSKKSYAQNKIVKTD